MKVECINCQKVYNIPDERLPMGKKVAFSCPNCKERISLDLRSRPEQEVPSPVSLHAEKHRKKEPSPPKVHLQDLPSGDALKEKLLKSLKDLPPMPQVVFKAKEIMTNPASDLKQLSKVIQTDMSIVSKILRMANSSYYGLPGKVSSVDHATVLLGQNTLAEVITLAGISGLLESALQGYDLESGDLWRHSMAVAFGSKILAERKKPELINDAFIAGLLHDAGKIILDKPVLERKELFDSFMEDGQQTFLNAETEILGFDHSEIASEMCIRWNIPESISLAIKYHHYPSRSNGDELAYILHIADYIATLSGIGIGTDDILYEVEGGALDFLNLTQKEISELVLEVIESNNKIA
ncbi:MAG: zinc-ribbon domain-containing protein [Deltaproteobacteria bacterium]|nr:zinc-ribbon domain-containing protein [Deltaproteobacteria bacterium]